MDSCIVSLEIIGSPLGNVFMTVGNGKVSRTEELPPHLAQPLLDLLTAVMDEVMP